MLCRADGMPQSALVLGSGEDELNNDHVEVDHHRLRQVELLQLLQEVYLLFRSWVMKVPRKQKDSAVSTGESLQTTLS